MANTCPALSKTALKTLKCSKCQNLLSVPPINMAKDGQVTCGRCNASTAKETRVIIYEELAKLMQFPCRYKDCHALLSWGQVGKHEGECEFREITCPSYNCNVACSLKTVQQHILKSHGQNTFFNNSDFVVSRRLRDMPVKHFQIDHISHYLFFDSQPFFLMAYGKCVPCAKPQDKIKSYSYRFGMFYFVKPKQEILYDLTVCVNFTHNGSCKYFWDKQPLEQYNELVYCFHCMRKNCFTLGHRKNNCNVLWNQIDNIENTSEITGITYSAKLYYKPQIALPKPVVAIKSITEQEELTSRFQCPICCEYMCAPIYICSQGHSICDNCRSKLTKCHFCQSTLGTTRNYTLEEITDCIKVPCYNQQNGCKYTGAIRSCKQHMQHCKFNVGAVAF